jgi:hypothetical protein
MSTILHDSTAVPPITCPDWCQTKPHDDPDGGFDGPHTWPALPAQDGPEDDMDDNGNSSALISVDLPEPGMDDEGTLIYLTAGNLTLSLVQARSVALALLTVADWAEGPSAADTKAATA